MFSDYVKKDLEFFFTKMETLREPWDGHEGIWPVPNAPAKKYGFPKDYSTGPY